MRPLAFVDLETTGATAATDRITEIGIIEVDADGSVREWEQLVNPGQSIPPFIEQLTGISNAMVAEAPPFAEVAGEALRRLEGRLFIAHNARFDFGFLKAEFARLEICFRAPVLCTVKLSRTLFPEHARHNLDSLKERHQLVADARHRALADARLIHQFWDKVHDRPGPEAVASALRAMNPVPNLPPDIDPCLLDEIPKTAGRYVFYGDDEGILYVGKAKNLRKRIQACFSDRPPVGFERTLPSKVRRIEWIEAKQ